MAASHGPASARDGGQDPLPSLLPPFTALAHAFDDVAGDADISAPEGTSQLQQDLACSSTFLKRTVLSLCVRAYVRCLLVEFARMCAHVWITTFYTSDTPTHTHRNPVTASVWCINDRNLNQARHSKITRKYESRQAKQTRGRVEKKRGRL